MEDDLVTSLGSGQSMKRWAIAAALLVASSLVCSSAAAPLPVVSGLDYQDKPLYDDQSLIGVTFTTSRAAPPGWEYGITFFIGGKYAVPGECTSIVFSWDRAIGGDGSLIRSAGKHFKILRGTRWGYWCRGSAHLEIVEHKIGSSAVGKPLGEGASLDFRIAEAP